MRRLAFIAAALVAGILGQVTGDVSFLDRPGPVTVQVQRAD